MAYYIIIRGPAGVGKTTVSSILVARIGAIIVNFDKVMDELGMDYVEGEKWIPLNNFLKADGTMLPSFRKDLDSGKNLILDGNFYHKGQIEDIANNLSYPHMAFTLKDGLKDCMERDSARENRLGEKADREVFVLVSAFDYGICIDTPNKGPAQIADEIYACISREMDTD